MGMTEYKNENICFVVLNELLGKNTMNPERKIRDNFIFHEKKKLYLWFFIIIHYNFIFVLFLNFNYFKNIIILEYTTLKLSIW